MAELAEALVARRLLIRRVIATAFALPTLYYVGFFFAVRQEPATLLQIGILLALGLAVTAFGWADHDSHSVSDTLNRWHRWVAAPNLSARPSFRRRA